MTTLAVKKYYVVGLDTTIEDNIYKLKQWPKPTTKKRTGFTTGNSAV